MPKGFDCLAQVQQPPSASETTNYSRKRREHEKNAKWNVDTPIGFWCYLRPFWETTMYAVIETGGKQYRVATGDTLDVERIETEAGKPYTFERVLLVANDGKVSVGLPTVARASVVADVTQHLRGEKKIAFKMKRRKGYHRTVGHRQELTRVKITEIKG